MSDHYPARITSLPHWVVSGDDKIPVDPKTLRRADTTNPATWSDYATARRVAAQHGLNLGFVFTKASKIVGTDLDHCCDAETGVIEPWALAIVRRLNTLTEISRSGTGLHMIAECDALPEGGRKRGGIEMYDSGRHFVMTGNILSGYETLANRTDELKALHAEVFAKPEPPKPPRSSAPLTLDTETVLHRVRKNDKGRQLHDGGDWKGCGYPSQSEADQGLTNLFVAAGADRSQADDLFRRSALFRDKWDQRRGDRTYGEKTLDRAFDGSVRLWDTFTPIMPAAPARTASDDACVDCDADPCAELQRENLRLRAELDQVRAELTEVKEQNHLLVTAISNPNIDGLGVSAIRTVMHIAHERRMGRAQPDGSVKATARKIGDDHRPFDEHAPILPASTAYAHSKRLEKLGLVERKIEPAQVRRPKQIKGEGGKWQTVRDDTGSIEYEDTIDKVTFLNVPGETVNDMLRPIAFFAPPPVDEASEVAHKPKRGGDRRSTKFRALKSAIESAPSCPHCGDDALKVVCTSCGCTVSTDDLTSAADAEDRAIKLETTGDETNPTPPQDRMFQNGTLSKGGVVANRAIKFETHGDDDVAEEPDWLRNAPDDSIAGSWGRARPMPGFEPSRIDWRTDITLGTRP